MTTSTSTRARIIASRRLERAAVGTTEVDAAEGRARHGDGDDDVGERTRVARAGEIGRRRAREVAGTRVEARRRR